VRGPSDDVESKINAVTSGGFVIVYITAPVCITESMDVRG